MDRESVGWISQMDISDWSNGIRYHIFDTRPDTVEGVVPRRWSESAVSYYTNTSSFVSLSN